MSTDRFPINPATAIAMAAFLAFPMHALAQSETSYFGGRAQRPVCVYKGVMSDAEIEACTGFHVRYDYEPIDPGSAASGASAGGFVQQATHSRRASHRRRH